MKLTLVLAFSNRIEILVLHEASREYLWLRSIMHHIQDADKLSSSADIQTVIYENNVSCIAQFKRAYIKGD